MKNRRTIADLMRENQYKLNEAPSPRTWRKLERRLDQKRIYKWSLYQQVITAVELAVIVVLFALVVHNLQTTQNDQRQLRGESTLLQELTGAEQDTTALRAVELTRQFRNRLAIAIEEGDLTRRFTVAASATENQMKASIADFTWLMGNWRSGDGQPSLEHWQRRNAQLLIGTGAVVERGDTVFLEQLRIYKSGANIFFETDFAQGQAPVRYVLQQFSPERMVFENSAMTFPQQIILERHAPTIYSLVMQNEAPLGLSAKQQTHLQHRNRVVNQHIVRVMERSNDL